MRVTKSSRSRSAIAVTTLCLQRCASPSRLGKDAAVFLRQVQERAEHRLGSYYLIEQLLKSDCRLVEDVQPEIGSGLSVLDWLGIVGSRRRVPVLRLPVLRLSPHGYPTKVLHLHYPSTRPKKESKKYYLLCPPETPPRDYPTRLPHRTIPPSSSIGGYRLLSLTRRLSIDSPNP